MYCQEKQGGGRGDSGSSKLAGSDASPLPLASTSHLPLRQDKSDLLHKGRFCPGGKCCPVVGVLPSRGVLQNNSGLVVTRACGADAARGSSGNGFT